MKNWIFFFLCIALLSLPLISCSSKMSAAEARPWLLAKEGPAAINVTGAWNSNIWGQANFTQTEDKLTGTVGDYAVEGKISGKDIYILFIWDNKVHYTAHLKVLSNNVLSGQYSSGTYVDLASDKTDIQFVGQLKEYSSESIDSDQIKWNIQSDPEGAHVFWRIFSSTTAVKNTERKYVGDTPIKEARPFKIDGLNKLTAEDVLIEIEIHRRGYQSIKQHLNCKTILEEKEIALMFELVSEH